jgi:hypothetical protein
MSNRQGIRKCVRGNSIWFTAKSPTIDWPQKGAKGAKRKTPLFFVPFALFCGEQF